MLSVPLPALLTALRASRKVLRARLADPMTSVAALVELSRVARADGVLSLESRLPDIEDDFLRKGVGLVVDGNDPEVVSGILDTEIAAMEARHQAVADVFKTMGGYTPTLGVLGTVMGLIHMLSKLSEPGKMGGAIAAAFIATMYGVGSANLLFLPIAAKLTVRSRQERAVREMMLEGILGLQSGDNPLTLQERLVAFISPGARAAANGDGMPHKDGGQRGHAEDRQAA